MATVLEAPQAAAAVPPSLPGFSEPEIVDGWAVFRNVPIFDEHAIEEEDPETGQRRVVRYTRDVLASIASNMNNRAAKTGDRALLAIGHTHPDPRVQSPEVVGFVGDCRVAPFRDKYAIFTDFWVFQEDAPRVKKNPRRSVEVIPEENPHDRWFDPVALLGAETPRRDLGMLYSHPSRGKRYQYSMWDESKHPRDHGKFSSTPGAQGEAGSGKVVQRGMFGEDFEPSRDKPAPKPKKQSNETQGMLFTGLDSLPGQMDMLEEGLAGTVDTAENRPPDNGEYLYFNGDRGRPTGKTEEVHGGTFQEIEMLEGPNKGEMKWVPTPEQKAADQQQATEGWQDQQAQFRQLREQRIAQAEAEAAAAAATETDPEAAVIQAEKRQKGLYQAAPSAGNTFIPGNGRRHHYEGGQMPLDTQTPAPANTDTSPSRIDPLAMQQMVDVLGQMIDSKISERLQNMGPADGINGTVDPVPTEPDPLDPMGGGDPLGGDPGMPGATPGVDMAGGIGGPEMGGAADPLGDPAAAAGDPLAAGSDVAPAGGGADIEVVDDDDDEYGKNYMRYMQAGDSEGAQTYVNDLMTSGDPKKMGQLHRYMQDCCADDRIRQHYMANCGQYQSAQKAKYSRENGKVSHDLKIRYERAEAARLSLENENKQLKAELAELRSKERYSFYRQELQQSLNEGIVLDIDEEMQYVQALNMDRDAFSAHHGRIKERYQRRPPSELIPTNAPTDPGSPSGQPGVADTGEDSAADDAAIERVAAARSVRKCTYARTQKKVVDYDATFHAERQKVLEHHAKTGKLLSEIPEELATA